MNGPVWCASGAGAGSGATEPRSRAAPGLGASAPFHSESRPERSGGPAERVGAVSTCGTMIHHVGGVFVWSWHSPLRRLCPARRLQSMRGRGRFPGKRSAQGAPATGGDRDRSGNRRERSDRRLQRIARAEGIARTPPRQFPSPLHSRTQPLPGICQPHKGWVSTRRAASARMLLRARTRCGPR